MRLNFIALSSSWHIIFCLSYINFEGFPRNVNTRPQHGLLTSYLCGAGKVLFSLNTNKEEGKNRKLRNARVVSGLKIPMKIVIVTKFIHSAQQPQPQQRWRHSSGVNENEKNSWWKPHITTTVTHKSFRRIWTNRRLGNFPMSTHTLISHDRKFFAILRCLWSTHRLAYTWIKITKFISRTLALSYSFLSTTTSFAMFFFFVSRVDLKIFQG